MISISKAEPPTLVLNQRPFHEIETLTRQFIHILSQFLVLSLSLDNDVMLTSKRCVKLFSLVFILKNFQTDGLLV